jgi:bifunctional non-homologous end joining protein LigD
MPSSFELMVPTAVKLPFSDPEWLFEPKWDGFRALCFLQDDKVKFISRKHNNLTPRFPDLQQISQLIKAETAIIDGEIVALDENGMPRFNRLRFKDSHAAIAFYAFDILFLDGQNLTQCPLVVRKAALKQILPKSNVGRIRYTEYVERHGERLFKRLETLELEGMVAKRKDSVYAGGSRTRLWLKVKTAAGKEEMQRRIDAWS